MWQTWHIVYYQSDRDVLLLEGVRPLLREFEARGLLARYMLRTHWRQGPHVMLDVEATPGHEEALAQHLEEGLRECLRRCPSRDTTPPEKMLELHRRLATMEAEVGAIEPLRADNSLHRVDYQLPFLVAGEGAARFSREFYTEATPLLLELMEQTREHSQRMERLLQLLMALTLVTGDLRFSHFSLRSHCEAFLRRFDRSQELRGKMERHVQSHREALLGSLERVRRHVEGGGEDGVLRGWAALAMRLLPAIHAQAEAGALSLPGEEVYAARGGSPAPANWTPSEFHQTVFSSRLFQWASGKPRFIAVRCLLNWHYGIFPLTRLVPLERIMLGYMTSRTAELATGLTWQETLRAIEEGRLQLP